MHSIELMEQCCEAARQLGYRIRFEWLGGTGGGACEFAGQKWIFVDLALSAVEQLEQVATVLRADARIHLQPLGSSVGRFLEVRRAA